MVAIGYPLSRSFYLLPYKCETNKYQCQVGFTTASAISAYHHLSCEFEQRSWQGYVIKFVSDLRQVGGFRRVLWFPPPIKQTATIQVKKSDILHT
jgi:hypothetical protein